MLQQIRIAVFALLAMGLIFYGVSFLPPLTSGGSSSPTGLAQERYETVFRNELQYCRNNIDDLNCRCFAQISGMIQADVVHRTPGAVPMNKQALGRMQAEDSC